MAVGRGPVSAGLGYEASGVEMDRGFVKVDELCQTNVPTISALGDLVPTPQLAHVGFGEGILVAERARGPEPGVPIDYDGSPGSPTPTPRWPRSASPSAEAQAARP